MDLARADPAHGLRVERSREIRLAEGEVGDPRSVTLSSIEVEFSWVEAGRAGREVVDLFRFKELYREATRRGVPVLLASGYTHQREAEEAAPAPEAAAGEFDLLALVRSLLRQEQESLGPAYG